MEYIRDNELPNGERAYDVILLDIQMPILDGMKVCELIKKHYEDMKREENEMNSMEG